MNMVLESFFGESIRVFIDDFCIYSSRALHLAKVEEGLTRLEKLGGQLNADKCHIGEPRVALLGHVVSKAAIEADPEKVSSLLAVPLPDSVKSLTSFIQKVRYLSRFIHLLSEIVSPLQQMTHGTSLIWSEENKARFQEVKEILSSLPTILPPQWDQEFFVNPSVGNESIGAVLLQKDPKNSHMRPVYFASRRMTKGEKEYTMAEQMVMSLMFAVQKFRPYLLPKKFNIITVEEIFPHVLQHMDTSARIAKWIVRLQEFDYAIVVEDSTRASLANILTHHCYEKKVKGGTKEVTPPLLLSPLKDAYDLYFDGAYKKSLD